MIGLPMLSGFIGEFIILSSTFALVSRGWAVAAALGVILGAAYMLWLVQRLFYGPESALATSKPPADLRFGELAILTPLVVLMLVMGLAPSLWLNSIQTGVHPAAAHETRCHPERPKRSESRRICPSSFGSKHSGGGPAVTPVPDIYRILPEVILTLTGVAIMLIDASLPPAWPRRIARLGRGHRNHHCPLGQPLAALSASGNRLLRNRRNQRLHRLLPRPHLRHCARCAPALA